MGVLTTLLVSDVNGFPVDDVSVKDAAGRRFGAGQRWAGMDADRFMWTP